MTVAQRLAKSEQLRQQSMGESLEPRKQVSHSKRNGNTEQIHVSSAGSKCVQNITMGIYMRRPTTTRHEMTSQANERLSSVKKIKIKNKSIKQSGRW